MIYLDNAATSFPKAPGVVEAVTECLTRVAGNPQRSGHAPSLQASRLVYSTRERLARLFNAADSSRIAFTPNATDALNTALRGMLRPGDHVVTTSIEHNAVARPLRALEADGVELTRVQCASTGELDVEEFATELRDDTKLAVVVHASNILGTILPIADLSAAAHEKSIPLLVDASQTAGHLPIDVQADGIALLAFTGHKGLLGPQGTGGLYLAEGIDIDPLRRGGTGSRSGSDVQPDFLPDRFEGGTLNTPGIAGLGAALEYIASEGLDRLRAHEIELTAVLLDGLGGADGITVYGMPDAAARVGLVAFNIGDLDPAEVADRLESAHGIISRPGLHCAPWAHATMGTLERGAVRLSVSPFTQPSQVEQAVDAARELAREH
ncbi:MAG: aminotransferase class V-fold PLP-dependent enzyme [Armatimonadota bacterium]|jgi:cysteine desulfurase family protein